MNLDSHVPQSQDASPSKEIDLNREMITRCTSFDELFSVIRSIRVIHSNSIGEMSADYIIKRIEQVRNGHRDITFITTSHGLRGTVEKLLENDRTYKKRVTNKK